MLISILSVTVDPLEMSWAEAALALAAICGDLNSEDLLRSFLLMWFFRKLNLSCIQLSPASLAFPLEPDQTLTGFWGDVFMFSFSCSCFIPFDWV